VRDDWRAWLPESKARLNENCSNELETLYLMLSVSLNEAFELRHQGAIAKSYEAAQVAGGLCTRFAHSLDLVLLGLRHHAKHFGLVPNAAPLDPENFRGIRGQRTARLAGFLARVLFTQRSRFIHKAATLHEMVSDLGKDFCEAAENLAGGFYDSNDALWEALDDGHFDLNTCLRETIVLLKSFLLVLPEEQIASFEAELQLPRMRTCQHGSGFRHRRFAAVPGK
jgi:hypothetical protein